MKSKGFHISVTVSLLLAALVFHIRPAAGANFVASLDRDSITLGETATLSLAMEGGQADNLPTPTAPGLRIVQSQSSQNVSIINGQMTSTVTVTFSVTPLRTGEFVIPSVTADVNGQRLSTGPVKLTVLKSDAPSAAALNSGSEIAFLKLTLPHEKIYSGQTIIGRVELYLRDDVQNFGSFSFSATPAQGFSIGKMIEGQRNRAQVGNRIYTVVQLLLPLTAVKSGALTVGPFTASAVVVLPSQNQGGNEIFRQFFNQGQQRQVTLTTEQVSVDALPLPSENVPADFNGAIGNFSLNVTAGPTNLTAGDPITVHVQISGRGALDAVTLPAQDAWREFKIFPATSTVKNTDEFGFQGIKTFEQIVSPLNSDVHELPPFTFSFFNPDDAKYHTLTQPAMPLFVHSAGATALPTIAGNRNSNAENPLQTKDILPIKENLGRLASTGPPLIESTKFLAIQSVPVLAFLAAFIWRRRADNLANNPRLRRKIAVEKLIQNGIGSLQIFAAENNSEEFFALLFRLLQERLGEKLDCPASAITENVVEENSILRATNEATRDGLRELFQLCNQARYAPVRGTSELNSVARQLEKTLAELQEMRV